MPCDSASAAIVSAVRGLPVVWMTSDSFGSHRGQQIAFQADLPHLVVGEHADDDNVGACSDVGQVGDRLRAEFAYGVPLLD